MQKRNYSRGIKVLLECGHEAILPTCAYRLPESLINYNVRHYQSRGVFCRHESHPVPPCCSIEKVLGTCRL